MRDERTRPGAPPSAAPQRPRPPRPTLSEEERTRLRRTRPIEVVADADPPRPAAPRRRPAGNLEVDMPPGHRGRPAARPQSTRPRRDDTPRGPRRFPFPRSVWGLAALGGALLGIVFLVLAVLDPGGDGASSSVSIRPGRRAPRVPAGAAGAAPGESPLKSSNYVESIEELHRVFGEPPDATFGRMRIPSLKVDAPLSVRAVPPDGQMPNPSGPDDVAYYDFSGLRGYGGFPTAGGNAVFAGHVDQAAHLDYAGVDYLGPGVFFRLREIDRGDTIEVDLGNGPVTYKVRWVREVAIEGGDWNTILGSNVSIDSLTLITCGGDYSTTAHAYTHRTVVRAERA